VGFATATHSTFAPYPHVDGYCPRYERSRGGGMSEERAILVARDGMVVTITLNRPAARNAMNYDALELLEHELDALEADPPRVVVLRGTSPGFCSGIDLKESREATSEFANRRVTLMHRVLRKLRRFPAPVIIVVDGVAAGLGCELAISGDIRIAGRSARYSYPEPRVSVPSPAHHLVWLIGLARAQDMLLTARWIDVGEAERFGVATRIADDVDTELAAEVERLLALSPRSLTDTKANIWRAIDDGAQAASEHHIEGVTYAAGTADRREALAAFAEKRDPVFRGN
jgi:enoyl-CoA hydratase/carnithine racemase